MTVKKLEKKMPISEVSSYLLKHRKYRLLREDELVEVDIENTSYTSKSIEENNGVNVYNPRTRKIAHTSAFFKLHVYLTHTDEYLKFIEDCREQVKQGDSNADKLLSKMLELYL